MMANNKKHVIPKAKYGRKRREYFHNEEPPPKEIVEDQSARGGDVRKRTLENYERPTKREVIPVNGFEEDSGNDTKVGNTDGSVNDEHGNLGVRSTRGKLVVNVLVKIFIHELRFHSSLPKSLSN